MSVDSRDQVQTPASSRSRLNDFLGWARRINLERKLSLILLIAALASVFATFWALTGGLPKASEPHNILLLLTLDLILLLCFGALVARRLVFLWLARRRDLAGSRLHSRLVGIFALVAITPTLIVAVFSVSFFEFGLQGWFSSRVSTAVKESLAVAEAYLEEHRQTIGGDVLAMAQDINRAGGTMLTLNTKRLAQIVAGQAALRSLTEAMVFDRSGRILAKAGYSLLLDLDPRVPTWAIDRADRGEVVILTPESEDRVQALVKLEAITDTYLFVGRLVDPRVLGHMQRSSDAVRLYEQLEGQRGELILTFALVYFIVSLMLLMASAWVGLAFANRLSRPLGRLVEAVQRVGSGDLTTRVDDADMSDEVGTLSVSFNAMTSDLERQRGELIEANRQIEERSQFIEAVLSGVSAGVIGLDKNGKVTLPNRSACELLSIAPEKLKGRKLANLSRDMRRLLEQSKLDPGRVHQQQLTIVRRDGVKRTLLVRIAAEVDDQEVAGYVVTFDDISELLVAQRTAAWADVARRIAHEIKNPLTPIQLSAERLKRKYLRQIDTDAETFAACTDTIVRHVTDIGRMVDEFSAFARMPSPVMATQDLRQLAQEVLTLQKSANSQITYTSDLPEEPVERAVDGAMIRQALINLLQNAADSIETRALAEQQAGAPPTPGEITIRIERRDGKVAITVADNGRGLPRAERDRLTEPYVTTREKGTGLGLAIVKKIMEEHGGDLILDDRPEGGAQAQILFPSTATKALGPATVRATAKNKKVPAHGA
jgi:two-component system nitrogen regulation sensor histidine kinase NtrY